MSSTVPKKTWIVPIFLAASLLTHHAFAATPDPKLLPVAKIYQNFAWEALSDDSDLFGRTLANQPVGILSQYFDPTLSKMLADDAACQRRTQEFCNLDFDLLFDAQDPRIADLTISAAAPNMVDVRFKDPVTEKETLITYTIAKFGQGWRISDVTYSKKPGKTLRAMLSRPLKRKDK